MSDAASRREQAMFDSSTNRDGGSVDFLIVGGGAAGSVLGNRLSEDSSVRVLLLEAGPDYAATRDVPEDLLDANQFPISHDWGYQSEPGVLGRSIPVPRAKVIGGSTAHNGAVAARGTPEDYDEWSRLGSPGWSFEQLLDDFRRLEDDPEGDVRYHGRGGPVPIRRYTDRLTLLHRLFIRTATASGFRRVEDVNGPDHIGVGVVARNVVDGVRQNGSIAYLERVRQRTNLEIRGEAEVDRVVIEEGRAVGVMLAVEGIRLARRLARTEPLASLHRGEVFPGDDVGDDADALTAVLNAGVSFYNHATGTVRMGPRSDPQAVVDATGAVGGVAGLSVADASIMPTPPSNPTTLTTMAIAEKIARDLRTKLYAARAAVPTVATGAA
jgi:choline dehydrogenase-like flavoprotein